MMKKLLVLILVYMVSWSMNIYSNPVNVNNVVLSDQRIVDTGGGNLRLREEPNIKSKKIGSITNRSYVKFIKSDSREYTINNIKGKWAYIEYNSTKGWVFEPFLIKIYSFKQNENVGQYSCLNEDKFLNKFKRIKKRKHFKPDDNKSETDKYDDYFEDNIVSKTIIYYGGGYSTTEFPGKNIKEVFDLYKKCDQKLNFIDFKISNNEFKVDFHDENSSSETYKFEFKDNKTIVFSGGQI